MAIGDKKTKQGIGEVRKAEPERKKSDGARSFLRESFGTKKAKTDPPVSSRRGPKPTQRGMPKEEKKIVTKAGLAPPSNPPAIVEPREGTQTGRVPNASPNSTKPMNPGLKAPPPLEELQYELDGTTGDRQSRALDDEERAARREEFTPREGTDLNDPHDQERADDRSKFRTAPGGGRNRVSGGRDHAAAYVSPATLPPGHGSDHITSAVKVDQIVANAVRAYETEPSLLRRRASSLPPRLPREYQRGTKLIWAAMVLGIALGGVVVWLVVAEGKKIESTRNGLAAGPKQPKDAVPAEANEEPVPVSAPVAQNSNSGSEDAPPAKSSSPEPQPVPEKALTATTTPSPPPPVPTPEPAAPPVAKPAAQPQPKKTSNDLWLE